MQASGSESWEVKRDDGLNQGQPKNKREIKTTKN